MIRRITNKLFKKRHKIPYNPEFLKDKVASKTEWDAMNDTQGANFHSSTLKVISSQRLAFRPTIIAIVFAGVILAIGIFVCIATIVTYPVAFASGIVGIGFTVAGVVLLYQQLTPIVFDKKLGYFWKGRAGPPVKKKTNTRTSFALLADIYAIQILPKSMSEGELTFEFNLVMKNASRVNVISSGGFNAIRRDAEVLSRFLNVPVWSMVERKSFLEG